jgi:hypothetical protein
MSLAIQFSELYSSEATRNYAQSDEPLTVDDSRVKSSMDTTLEVNHDSTFWRETSRALKHGQHVVIHGAVLSEWVPRIPGLYWEPESEVFRELGPATVEKRSEEWVQYDPAGKSSRVAGGIGTLRLSPSESEHRLMSVSTTENASAGIPILVPPIVMEKCGLSEGDRIRARARWVQIPTPWINAFEQNSAIPRGVLKIDGCDDVEIGERGVPVQVHPYSVMEYRKGPALFHDFVYYTADTRLPTFREEVAEFFDNYKEEEGRLGRYLLAADTIEGLWDASYNSPRELRNAKEVKPMERGMELRLLEARKGLQLILDLINRLVATDRQCLEQLASTLRISRNSWCYLAYPWIATRFVIAAALHGKLDALRAAILPDRPPIPGTSPDRPLGGLGPRRMEDLIIKLASLPNQHMLETLGDQIISCKSHWYLGGSQSEVATQLVVEAKRLERFDDLERLVERYYPSPDQPDWEGT